MTQKHHSYLAPEFIRPTLIGFHNSLSLHSCRVQYNEIDEHFKFAMSALEFYAENLSLPEIQHSYGDLVTIGAPMSI